MDVYSNSAQLRIDAASHGGERHAVDLLAEVARARAGNALVRLAGCALSAALAMAVVENYWPLIWLVGLVPVLLWDAQVFKRLYQRLEAGRPPGNEWGHIVWIVSQSAYTCWISAQLWHAQGAHGEPLAVIFLVAGMANGAATMHVHPRFALAGIGPTFAFLIGLPLTDAALSGFSNLQDLVPVCSAALFVAFCFNLWGSLRTMRNRMQDAHAETVRVREAVALAQAAEERALNRMSRALAAPLAVLQGVIGQATRNAETDAQKEQYEDLTYAIESISLAMNETVAPAQGDHASDEADVRTLIDLRRHLRLVMTAFRPVARAKGLELFLDISASVPKQALVDAARLRVALTDLVANALRYTCHGGVRLRVDAKPAGARGKTALTLSVIDTGPGMPHARVQQMFGDQEVARAQTGGVARVRAHVARLGGRLGVKSAPGEGTIVSIQLDVDTPVSSAQSAA